MRLDHFSSFTSVLHPYALVSIENNRQHHALALHRIRLSTASRYLSLLTLLHPFTPTPTTPGSTAPNDLDISMKSVPDTVLTWCELLVTYFSEEMYEGYLSREMEVDLSARSERALQRDADETNSPPESSPTSSTLASAVSSPNAEAGSPRSLRLSFLPSPHVPTASKTPSYHRPSSKDPSSDAIKNDRTSLSVRGVWR